MWNDIQVVPHGRIGNSPFSQLRFADSIAVLIHIFYPSLNPSPLQWRGTRFPLPDATERGQGGGVRVIKSYDNPNCNCPE